ncbi:MAG: methyltransferase type 11, partial [Rubritepida sp.]|nr:methyltransferase type 11 [Rubritepida sp.]
MIADTAHAVRDAAGRRWPAPDGIAFLRIGREALADAALARLDAGDRTGALVLLLAD